MTATKGRHFFIERPIFAAVLSIVMTLVGAIAFVKSDLRNQLSLDTFRAAQAKGLQ